MLDEGKANPKQLAPAKRSMTQAYYMAWSWLQRADPAKNPRGSKRKRSD